MTEIVDKIYDSIEYDYEVKNLRKAGYKRVQNCFWVEHWVKGNTLVILERDY